MSGNPHRNDHDPRSGAPDRAQGADRSAEATAPAAPVLPGAEIPLGTRVMTAEGALPVEFLYPGDRIVTRSGMKPLRAVSVRLYDGPAVRIGASTLGHDRPERDLLLPASSPVLLRDWRVRVLYGRDEALVEAARLIDDRHVRGETVRGLRVFALAFDTPQLVYADGVELICAATADAAPSA